MNPTRAFPLEQALALLFSSFVLWLAWKPLGLDELTTLDPTFWQIIGAAYIVSFIGETIGYGSAHVAFRVNMREHEKYGEYIAALSREHEKLKADD